MHTSRSKRAPRSGLVAAFAVLLALTAITSLVRAPGAHASTLPTGFQESTAFSGLTNPTVVRFASDGRVFVAEKSGLIKVFDGLSDSSPTVFADLRTQVYNFWDRGLLGLALDPDFPATPYVYVLYTYDKDPSSTKVPRWGTVTTPGEPAGTSDPCPTPPGATTDGCVVSGRLSRLTASGDVMTGQEEPLLTDWCQQFPSHSVGSLAFGADGKLYVSGGEGAGFFFADYGQTGSFYRPENNPCLDPPTDSTPEPPGAEGGALRSQDLRSSGDPTGLDGSILRLDPSDGSAVTGNPLYSTGSDANARRIVATGLRNPFRFTIRPGTNELWIGDVGWNTSEEIDRLQSGPSGQGRNFGWPCFEGAGHQDGFDTADLSLCEQLYASTGSATDLVNGTATAPYYAYDHSSQVVEGESCPSGTSSISGLDFYDGSAYPVSYDGALFFADYSRDCIWVMRAGAGGLPDPATVSTFAADAANPVDVQIGPDGNLYYADFDGGTIKRVRYFSDNQPPIAVATADRTSGPAPLTVDFDGSESSDPDPGDTATLTYAWDLDGDGQYDDSTSKTPTYTYTAGNYTASLKVTDDERATATAAVAIQAGNTPPVPAIYAPNPDTQWSVGQRIDFFGGANDGQDGPLPASALDWRLIMHHCPSSCHTHQIQSFDDTVPWFFNAPDHEYPSFIELELTATDSNGATASTSVELDPRTVDLTLDSKPPGLDLTLNSQTQETPFTATLIEGSNNSIGAPSPQIFGGQAYSWLSWSDGGARTHNITAGASATYTAEFSHPAEVAVPEPLPGESPGPGLELDAGAKPKQKPEVLAIWASCPLQPCEVTAAGEARGVSFKLEDAQMLLQAGQPQLLRLRATNRRKLAHLERRLKSGEIDGPVLARIEVTATGLVDGSEASKLVKVRLRA